MRDNLGTELQDDQVVAYNLSGQVVMGKLIKTQPIRIELLHNAVGLKAGHISQVKNSGSVLVLEQACPHCGQSPLYST